MMDDEYYKHVIGGTGLFRLQNSNLYGFTQWKLTVAKWLTETADNPTVIAEWESLDENNKCLGGFLNPGGGLLEKISNHYDWLARYPSGKLPSENEKLLDLLRSKQDSKEIEPHFYMGLNCFNFKELDSVHDSFHLWLRTISDFFQETAPNSGLSAEWLSLPSITIYFNGGTTSDPNFSNQLSMAVKDRFVWIGIIFNINISDKYKQVDKKAEELSSVRNILPTAWQAHPKTNGTTLSDATNKEKEKTLLIKTDREKKIKWEYPLCVLGGILALEAEDKKLPISYYVKEKARNYIKRNGKPVNGDSVLNNYYVWRKREDLEEIKKKCKEISNQLEKNSNKRPTQKKL